MEFSTLTNIRMGPESHTVANILFYGNFGNWVCQIQGENEVEGTDVLEEHKSVWYANDKSEEIKNNFVSNFSLINSGSQLFCYASNYVMSLVSSMLKFRVD